MKKESDRCFEVLVGCHELLGHGSGKLIYRDGEEKTPSFVDPITGETYESCYEKGELYNEKFGSISTSYEECRADTCAFFFAPMPEVYTLFGFKEDEVDTLLWVQVYDQCRRAIIGL
jgi:dipeptidyl-peptidase-3